MGALIGVLSKHNVNVANKAIEMMKALQTKNANVFGLASSERAFVGNSLEDLIDQDVDSPILVGHVASDACTRRTSQLLRLDNRALVFDGRVFSGIREVSSSEFVARKLGREPAKIGSLLKEYEGSLAFVIAEPQRLIVGRDSMGMKPLYYGENLEIATVASQRKALWRAGVDLERSFPPGHVGVLRRHKSEFKEVRAVHPAKLRDVAAGRLVNDLTNLLRHSTEQRVLGLKRVAVAFSGGLDSSVIATLAKRAGVDAHLIHVGLRGRVEIDGMRKIADALELPIHIGIYGEDDVEMDLPKIPWLIEESDPVAVSIAVPIYWIAQRASSMRFRFLLAGQGADELFGGYRRYSDCLASEGEEAAREMIANDVQSMHEVNFERDAKICAFHDVELCLPFASHELVEYVAGLPLRFKISSPDNLLRKPLLRKIAKCLELPESIVNRPKKAIQYQTGVNSVIKKLARERGYSTREYIRGLSDSLLARERPL